MAAGAAVGPRARQRGGLDFYRRLAEGLLERGIEPIATLYHWDLPQALQDPGGWGERDTAQRFAEYAALVAAELGDAVSQWITHNEPWVVAFLGHAYGTKAPGIRHWPTALRASHHLLLSHGLALRALRAQLGELAQIGIALNQYPFHPAASSEADRDAARRMDGHLNRWFLDPVLRGRYPADMLALYEGLYGPAESVRDGDLAVIRAPIDFLGVNYYNPQRIAAAPGDLPLQARQVAAARRRPRRWAGRSTPTACTRCSRACAATTARCRSTSPRTAPPSTTRPPSTATSRTPSAPPTCRATSPRSPAPWPTASTCAATACGRCMDNFEWEEGYDKRFGIVHVDFATQARVPKRSALWYRDFIARVRAAGGS